MLISAPLSSKSLVAERLFYITVKCKAEKLYLLSKLRLAFLLINNLISLRLFKVQTIIKGESN